MAAAGAVSPIRLTREEFEVIAQEAYESLPDRFHATMDNVHIVVEDRDSASARRRVRLKPGSMLLGLYEGIPLTRRGSDYGVHPVLPDRITLFQRNIEDLCSSREEVREEIRKTLIHEIGHYYGMSEREIRDAGY